MLLSHPGPVFKTPTSGIKPTRKEAARELLDCWRAFKNAASPAWLGPEINRPVALMAEKSRFPPFSIPTSIDV